MANRLSMALAHSIQALHRLGWSQRRIARELNINRETVARYLHDPNPPPKPANAPLDSHPDSCEPKPANAPIATNSPSEDSRTTLAEGDSPTTLNSQEVLPETPAEGPSTQPTAQDQPRHAGRLSDCEPFRQVILDMLDQDLCAQRIYQDLKSEHAFVGSYYSVRRFVKRQRSSKPLPFRRLECQPAEEAQVDFGTGAPILDSEGKRRRSHVFRIVLSHSRKAYSEVVFRQTTDNFLLALENAFRYFGGTPGRVILDNLRAAVTTPDWYDPVLNPKLEAFAAHYSVVMLPTKPYTPRHKGKVERGIDYVQENALKGRTFASLIEQNAYLLDWEATVADVRVHGTTRQLVGKTFEERERPALAALPSERFPCFHEAQRKVHRDGHIEVDRAFYSVPAEYADRRLWVRWDTRVVRIFNDRFEQIALHVKHSAGRFSTQQKHILTEKINAVERGAEGLLPKVRLLGTECGRWAEAMLEERGVPGVRLLQGLLALANKYSSAQLEQACRTAAEHGAYHLRTLRTLLGRNKNAEQAELELVSEDPLIRPLSEYDKLVADKTRERGDDARCEE